MKYLLLSLFILLSLVSCAQNEDKIIGIWKVKNNNYQATYEIVAH